MDNQSSYLSQNSLVQHFGLSKDTWVDSLKIQWPDGAKQDFENIAANQKIEITEGEDNFKENKGTSKISP